MELAEQQAGGVQKRKSFHYLEDLEKWGVGGGGATAGSSAVPGLLPVPEYIWLSGQAGGRLQLETERVPDSREHHGQKRITYFTLPKNSFW